MLNASLDAKVNGSVTFTFTVINDGDSPVDLQFRSGQLIDVVVYDDDGAELWRWGATRMFTQALQSHTLDPGDELTQEVTWDDPSDGTYEAEGTLEAVNQSASARTTFTV